MAKSAIEQSMQDTNHDARQYARDAVTIVADVRVPSGGRYKVKIVDLSQAGFRMACPTYIPDDLMIFLTVPGFAEMEARVIWGSQWLYGCRFNRPLYAAIYDHIVRTHPELVRPERSSRTDLFI